MSFMNGLVFFSPVALLVRTTAGVGVNTFFLLQALLSGTVFLFEIPTGKISDRIGYRNTLILSQGVLCLARVLLFFAFCQKSILLFAVEAFIEGLANCFLSGTQSAYIYSTVPAEKFMEKTAVVANYGTIGFIVSTVSYAFLFHSFGLSGLLVLTIISSGVGLTVSFFLQKETGKAVETERGFHGAHVSSFLQKETGKADRQKNIGNVSDSPYHNRVQNKKLKAIWNKQSVVIIMILSCISIAFLLINFFYVERIQFLQLNASLLTPVILGYSVIQLLVAKIVGKVHKGKTLRFLINALVVAGVGFLLFGMCSRMVVSVILLLLLPLFADLPAYAIDMLQNEMIDQIDKKGQRAEIISIYNMGVNFVDILFLFASAVVSKVGIPVCFGVLGGGMVILAVVSYFVLKKYRFAGGFLF